MKKLFTLTFLCTIVSLTVLGQHQFSGKITDQSGEGLPGATVHVLNTSKGAVSDTQGNFSINNMNSGTYFIKVSYVGFQSLQKKIEISGDLKQDFKLSAATAELGEIIVTANKQLQNIQETPIAMTAIQSKQIEQLQINELVELNRVAANFKSYDDGGGSFQTLASRGIYSIDATPAVGLYVDDVPFFNIIGFPTLFSDIERIEVLKGPQGTLYGRNALAGAVNIITKRPTNITNGFVRFGYGNLNQLNAAAGVSFPLVQEKVYARVHGSFTQRDGYINNIALDTDNLLSRESFSGGARLNFFPSERLHVTLHTNIEDRSVDAYALVGGFDFPRYRLDSLRENHPFWAGIEKLFLPYNPSVFKSDTEMTDPTFFEFYDFLQATGYLYFVGFFQLLNGLLLVFRWTYLLGAVMMVPLMLCLLMTHVFISRYPGFIFFDSAMFALNGFLVLQHYKTLKETFLKPQGIWI